MECAEALEDAGHYGPACAHLVLAVEEAVKARVFRQWPTLRKAMTDRQLRELLYTHPVRHGLVVYDSMPQSLLLDVALWQSDHRGGSIDRKSLSRLFTRHAEAFPLNWARTADKDKQRGTYVDWDGRSWRSPARVTKSQYQRRRARCLEFLLKMLATVGEFDEIRAELAEFGWDVDKDRI
jgi:AbiV family abortive infection protein